MPQPETNSHPVTKSLAIRAAKFDDLAAILVVERSASRAAHWSFDHYEKRIGDEPAAACFLVAEYRGKTSENKAKVCGFLCARIVGIAGEWEIENVVVEEKFRRQGIASKLMESLIKNWGASAGTALLLEVRESNTAARTLYERHGLCEVGRRRSYYRDPSEGAILYARTRK
jgi:ribosomal protein S18 acetylase RimI-like enzyme